MNKKRFMLYGIDVLLNNLRVMSYDDHYYSDKLEALQRLFASDRVLLDDGKLIVDGYSYPILDDVIILLDTDSYPYSLKRKLGVADMGSFMEEGTGLEARAVQFTFGEEWKRFSEIKPEYEKVFNEYFDLLDMDILMDKIVCDLGCGTGRWSLFLAQKSQARSLLLVDFSEAIFVARNNLRGLDNALFFMGDIRRLPFRNNFADFIFSLGVLHHLNADALEEVRALKKYAPLLLIYLYYKLDNRPIHFRWILSMVTTVRKRLSKIQNPAFRDFFSLFVAASIYAPLVGLGYLVKPLGLSRYVPLYGGHHYMNFRWWRLLAYDRFFTPIEQRFSRKEIMALRDTFSEVVVSSQPAYWHFLCRA
jgi:SAM-dependent methyltransferase